MAHRFFIHNFIKSDSFTLSDKEIVHQCFKVLRLKAEDFISFFNAVDTTNYLYKISNISKDSIELTYVDESINIVKNNDITLYQAIPNKLSKLEFIVQKCSETGVRKIIFFRSHYSQEPKFLSPKKIERLQKIAIESAEQSGRNTILELNFKPELKITDIQENQIYCFHTKNNNSKKLKDLQIDITKNVSLVVGPEGGFHENEIQTLKTAGATIVHLGENILRTESVGFGASFFITQYFLNN